jgi:transposase-like protein
LAGGVLGIDTDGVKHSLGLWDGSTENATVATALLANLVEGGLDVEQGLLVVIDGGQGAAQGRPRRRRHRHARSALRAPQGMS